MALFDQVREYFDGYTFEEPVQLPSGAWKWSVVANGDDLTGDIWFMLVSEKMDKTVDAEWLEAIKEYNHPSHSHFLVIPPEAARSANTFPVSTVVWRGVYILPVWKAMAETILNAQIRQDGKIVSQAEFDERLLDIATDIYLHFDVPVFGDPWEPIDEFGT